MYFKNCFFPALDSTDFCDGKVGTWASRGGGHGPPDLPSSLYPPLATGWRRAATAVRVRLRPLC